MMQYEVRMRTPDRALEHDENKATGSKEDVTSPIGNKPSDPEDVSHKSSATSPSSPKWFVSFNLKYFYI